MTSSSSLPCSSPFPPHLSLRLTSSHSPPTSTSSLLAPEHPTTTCSPDDLHHRNKIHLFFALLFFGVFASNAFYSYVHAKQPPIWTAGTTMAAYYFCVQHWIKARNGKREGVKECAVAEKAELRGDADGLEKGVVGA